MIVAHDISKRYAEGTLALDRVNLKIDQGEFVAVIGLSGAGKSTLLRLINGTLKPTSGTMQVLGADLAHATSADVRGVRRKIGFIFQQFNLVKRLTVLQNVLTGRLGYHGALGGLFGFYNAEDLKLAVRYLDEVGLEGRHFSRADQLSGGQQQRVAIARALVQDPKIILADEPMASLDPRLSDVVLEILQRFNQKKNITVVVNIHVLEMARKYASRVIGMRLGQIIFDGKPSELTEALLKEIYDR